MCLPFKSISIIINQSCFRLFLTSLLVIIRFFCSLASIFRRMIDIRSIGSFRTTTRSTPVGWLHKTNRCHSISLASLFKRDYGCSSDRQVRAVVLRPKHANRVPPPRLDRLPTSKAIDRRAEFLTGLVQSGQLLLQLVSIKDSIQISLILI